MWKPKYRSNKKGFTFIELLVTITILVILVGGVTVAVTKVKSSSRQTNCETNLKKIAMGLQMYHSEKGVFPEDGYPDDANDPNPLSTELASYVREKSAFICPEDKDQTSTSNFASYDPFYIERIGSNEAEELLIGCPRHREATKATSLFYAGFPEITSIGTVLANGQEIPPDGTTAQRTISSEDDVMTFADGSTVKITGDEGGYGTFLVQSVELADGTLYSIVRVKNEGEIDVQVSSGSKFEIITPSAIVGVRGTRFTVKTENLGYTTVVTLINGVVEVKDRATGQTTTLATGGTTEITVEEEMPEVFDDDKELIDLFREDPPLSSSELRDSLISASPLSSTVLDAMIHDTTMSSSHIYKVLIANSPLPTEIENQIKDGTTSLSESDTEKILTAY